MKRRYKPGDWFRVPLFAPADALGIITHASGSRLFGYFFAAAGDVPFDELRALRAGGACARFLFGALPIETLRWPVIATSIAFDQSAWPFPPFAQRGAFGRRWTLRTFDPTTLRKISERSTGAADAAPYPAAQLYGADYAERLLAGAMEGRAPAAARVICEVRAPIDAASLEPLRHGGRVQVSTALAASDVAALARIETGADVELRVHDVHAKPFDLRVLNEWKTLATLTLDTVNVTHLEVLRNLPYLRRLRIAAHALASIDVCEHVRDLYVAGSGEHIDVRAWRALERLTCENVTLGLESLAGLPLRDVSLRHVSGEMRGIAQLPTLDRLELRDVPLESFEALRGMRVRTLVLNGIRLVRDLSALAHVPELRLVRFDRMPQLHPVDFDPLVGVEGLRVLSDSGNRTLDREIQRRFMWGRMSA